MIHPPAVEGAFFSHASDNFCRSLLKLVFSAKRLAWDHCQAEFASAEAENVRPWYTRGKIEAGLREIVDRFDGLTAKSVRAQGSGWNHVEVSAGAVTLTAAAVQTPCGTVNKADFRVGLAERNQHTLFDAGDSASSELYVMLLHSSYRSMDPNEQKKFGHLPGSAYLAFPDSSLNFHLHAINLFDKYPDVVRENIPQDWTDDALVRYIGYSRKSAWLAAS